MRPRKKHRGRGCRGQFRGGFTLIEVLTTMIVLSVVLPVAMEGISVAMTLGSNARKRTEAATLAHSKLEELVATGTWQTAQLSGDFSAENFPDYKWTATINPWTDSTMYEVDVQVTWTAHRQDHSITIGTIIDSTTGS